MALGGAFFPGDDILLDGADMPSSSVVLFSSGLSGIALGVEALSTMVPGTYDLWSTGHRNSTSWPGFSWDSGFMLWNMSKCCFCDCFFMIR